MFEAFENRTETKLFKLHKLFKQENFYYVKEYGSNIQKLADYIISLPEKDQRTKYAHILIELMRQIHPNMRDGVDYSKKLWDDLYVMTNFDLDVESPFPPPPKDILGKKPMLMGINQHKLAHRFYGRNLELLILKAMITEDYTDRVAFVSYLVRLMKSFYLTWNKDSIETEDCLQQILQLSGFRLQTEVEEIRKNGLMESSPKDGNSKRQQGGKERDSRDSRDNRDRDSRDNRDSREMRGNDNRDRKNNHDNRNRGGYNDFKNNNNRNNNNRNNNNKNNNNRRRG